MAKFCGLSASAVKVEVGKFELHHGAEQRNGDATLITSFTGIAPAGASVALSRRAVSTVVYFTRRRASRSSASMNMKSSETRAWAKNKSPATDAIHEASSLCLVLAKAASADPNEASSP